MATLITAPPVPAHENIFSASFTGGKALTQKRAEEIRARNMKTAYIYLIFAGLILIVYSALFFYPQGKLYLQAPARLESLQSDIRHYGDVVLPALSKEKDLHRAAYDKEFSTVEDALDIVFPPDVAKLELVRTLENFAMAINAKSPPFEFSSMSLGESKQENGYTVVPISTSIYASKTNFDRFLQLINLSGRMEGEVKIRLMSVGNISIRYRGPDPQTGEDKGVDFTVKLNAYSRS